MQKWPASQQLVLEIGEFQPRRGLPFVVPAANAQRDAISFRNDDRCRPNLDCKIDGAARLQPLNLVMAVIGAVRLRQGCFELAMRRAQPALRHRGMRINRACKRHLAQVCTEYPEGDKDIGVLGAGRNP